MTGRFRKEEDHSLDAPIEAVLNEMQLYGPDTEEFTKNLGHLERLYRLKGENNPKDRLSRDTMAIVLGNLAGILIVVAYEQRHVMTSKAFGFTLKKNP